MKLNLNKIYIYSCIALTFAFAVIFCFMLSSRYIRLDTISIMPAADIVDSDISTAYAYSQGLTNADYTSALGFFNDALPGNAFKFLDYFNLGLNKVNFTASLIFGGFCLIIFILARNFLKIKIPYLAILIIIMLCPLGFPRDGHLFATIHNVNLWALFFLQTFLCLTIFKNKEFLSNISNKDLIKLGFICSLAIYIAFNYKMNYFAANGLCAICFIWQMSFKNAVKYLIYLLLSFLLLNFLTAMFFHYDYGIYILAQLETNGNRTINLGNIFKPLALAILCFGILWGILCLDKISKLISPHLRLSLKKWGYFLSEFLPCSCQDFKNLFVAFIFSLASFLILILNTSDGSRYYLAIVLIFSFIFIKFKYKDIIFFLAAFAYVIFLLWIFIRTFYGGESPLATRVIIDNINPKHKLEFFYFQKYTDDYWNKMYRKYGGMQKQSKYPQACDALIAMYKKFSLNTDDTFLIADYANYAPFILNSHFPLRSVYFINEYVNEISEWYTRMLDNSNIIVFPKTADTIIYKKVVEIFANHIKANAGLVEFYEDEYFEYYSRRQWLKEKGISF